MTSRRITTVVNATNINPGYPRSAMMKILRSAFACWTVLSCSSNAVAWAPLNLSTRQVSTITVPNHNLDHTIISSKLNEQRRNNEQEQLASTVATSTKRSQKGMIDFMTQPMRTTVGDAMPSSNAWKITSADDAELYNHLRCIISAADGRKADNIVVLNVRNASTICSYMIILTGNSRPQNQAIAATIDQDMKDNFQRVTVGNGIPEGNAESGWIVMDYGTVMVHIMTPKSRLYYNVEGQWKEKGGIPVDISHLIVPNQVNENKKMELQSKAYSYNLRTDEDIETDPFWS